MLPPSTLSRFVRVACLAAAALFALGGIAAAQPATGAAAAAPPPAIPQLWDARERLPKPDLAALPRLRFLTTVDFPPFNSLDGEGRLVGFHVDLARLICAELGVSERCEIQALPWAELQPALGRGEGEAIIAGVAASAAARETLSFSRPYLWFPARFVARADAVPAEPLHEGLAGKAVGVLAGSAHERLLRDRFPALKPVPFPAPEAMQAALTKGEVAAVFGDGMRLSFWLAGAEGTACCRFAGGPYLAPDHLGTGLAIAVRRDDTVLADALDYALQRVAVSSRWAELYLRHFPVGFF